MLAAQKIDCSEGDVGGGGGCYVLLSGGGGGLCCLVLLDDHARVPVFIVSYIGSARISIDFAHASSAEASTTKKKGQSAKDFAEEVIDPEAGALSPQGVDILKDDYLQTMRKRSAAKCWANDETLAGNMLAKEGLSLEGNVPPLGADDDAHSAVRPAFDRGLSDLEYLKMKAPPSEAATKKKKRKSEAPALDDPVVTAALSAPSAEQTGRVLIKNIPFSVDEEELRGHFSQAGAISRVHLPEDGTRRQRGFAFVNFERPSDATRAVESLNKSIFQGRVIEVVAAAEREPSGKESGAGKVGAAATKASGTYKQLQAIERRRQAMETTGWSASHVASDAVADSITARLSLAKRDLLDRDEGNMVSW